MVGIWCLKKSTQNIPRFWWLGFGALGNLYKSTQKQEFNKNLYIKDF